MEILFLILLTSHLLVDFVLHPCKSLREKGSDKAIIKHSAFVIAVVLILSLSVNPLIYAFVFVAHLIIDKLTLGKFGDGIKSLAINQILHTASLLIIASLFANTAYSPAVEIQAAYSSVLITVCGLILCVSAGAVLIEKLTAPFAKELETQACGGLTNGGKLIGQLERAMVYALVLFGNPAAIGFIFAAKSILRFGEIKDTSQRKQAEYIIIGTFASFGWAIFISFSTATLLGL